MVRTPREKERVKPYKRIPVPLTEEEWERLTIIATKKRCEKTELLREGLSMIFEKYKDLAR